MVKLRYNENFPDSVCEIENCNEVATKIIRTKLVCGRCYSIILRDNIWMFNNDLEITEDLTIRKACYKYRCRNKITVQFKYDIVDGKKELLPKYCSDRCSRLDDDVVWRRMNRQL